MGAQQINTVFKRACIFVVSTLSLSGLADAQINVTTYHNDLARTGLYAQETVLTPANVNSNQFGKLFSTPVDGAVFAQPLYLSAVAIGGGTHNVLYAATEHDSVYAIDADSGSTYAHVNLIPPGGTTVSGSDVYCGDITPEIGITGTPVIDAASGTLYVVAKSKLNGTIVQYLHALDVNTLAEKFNGPVQIQFSVAGSGYDSSGGRVTFNAHWQNQRAALLLQNGHVVIGWAAHCDQNPWHGWVVSYNARTLGLEAIFNASPSGSQGGIWMSGGGFSADASGNLYFATGNGSWNGTSEFGDSIIKLGPPSGGAFPLLDYFTPFNQASMSNGDADLGSGGLVLLPKLASGRQLLAQQSKQGTIYLLDASNLGRYCPALTPACSNSDSQIVQEIRNASSGVWGSPAYWNGNIYWTGANDPIKAYSVNATTGLLSPTSQSTQIFAFSAPTPAVSANGTSNAILWALDGSADTSSCVAGSNCLGLYAYDATDLAHVLYISSQAANNRDSPGVAVKFATPIIANGKVYVGTKANVSAYGLLAGVPPVTATPTFSPAGGSYGSAQSVSIADATPGATIYYTTNGSAPSTGSAVYSGAIAVNASETLRAIAVASGYSSSP
ncbi:MAG: chitobiase/beta-hexosaminidase C-terminal domain-containing protein, partial [Pseudomonadota bacterium]|nr:chitobiase/beta-hexosaminidase C-terminal domain-containing protein [Pseudomonadota bacterium]